MKKINNGEDRFIYFCNFWNTDAVTKLYESSIKIVYLFAQSPSSVIMLVEYHGIFHHFT